MVHRRFGILKYLTSFVAPAAVVFAFAARSAEPAPQGLPAAHGNSAPAAVVDLPEGGDGMSWCRLSGDVNMRVNPSTANQPVSTLFSGEYIRAKVAQNNFLEMEWPKKISVWVLKDSVQIAPNDPDSGSIRAIKARIMGRPTNNGPEIAVLPRGSHVAIVGEDGGWYRVQAPATARAYVSAKFVVVGVQPPTDVAANAVPAAKPAAPARQNPQNIPAPQNIQSAQKAGGETVDLGAAAQRPAPAAIKEPEAGAGEVVIAQQQTAWPKANVALPGANPSKRPADDLQKTAVIPVAPKAVAKQAPADNDAAPADEVPLGRNKFDMDAQLERSAAVEKKRMDELENARKVAEAKKAEIDTQVQAAAERKRVLESEIAKLSDEQKKFEADELARQASEKKRVEDSEKARLASEEHRKADLIEQSRLAAERKRIEDEENELAAVQTKKKVEIETQTRAAAERKKVLEDEIARLGEAKKKSEEDERARISAEKKRLAEAETARVAAELKKAELEEQAQKAAEKKKALEVEIAHLAEAKKKDELEAVARAAREKKAIEESELAKKDAEARRKSELEELAKKEAEKKKLDEADALRAVADAKRRAELQEQERAALARKKSLEEEIARLYDEKRKYEDAALARVAADKKNFAEAETMRLAAEQKKKLELEELTKLATEKKHLAEEAEQARASAEKKRAEENEGARQAAARKKVEEEEIARLAAQKKRVEDEAAQAAAEKKRIEEESAQLAAANRKRVQEEENARQETARKLADEQAKAVAAAAQVPDSSARLPDPTADVPVKASRSISLTADRPILLNELDMAGDPNEANYNANYVPQSIRDVQKKYVVPPDAPKKAQPVGDLVDVDATVPTAPAAKAPAQVLNATPVEVPSPAKQQPAQAKSGETVELPPQAPVQRQPVGPALVHVNDSNFSSEIENFKGVVMVDFSATWCGPCRSIASMVNDMAEEYRGKIKVVKIDVDEAPGSSRRFGISGIPCLMIFKDGKNTETRVGAPSRESLKRWMDDNAPAQPTIQVVPAPRSTGMVKDPGMKLTPPSQRYLISDVGTLQRVGSSDIDGVKYMLLSGGTVLRYIIEPSDVDMSAMVGRTISITGYGVGRSYSDVSVLRMKNAATFG